MKTSLLFPPTWHPSQPYLSLPSLSGFLAQGGVTNVSQHDLGVELLNGVTTQSSWADLYQEIKSDHRIESTVIDDPVNVLISLCGEAGKGKILLSAPFRAALGFLSPLKPLPSIELKGKGQALPVFRVKR
jgi:hypothetical protein